MLVFCVVDVAVVKHFNKVVFQGEMDVQTGLVCVAVVVVSAVVIFVISMFGIKEKTYEEAIAEQRKMPEENLLLGRSSKDKTKDKKQKKAGKKVKEKPVEQEKTKQSEAVPSVPIKSIPQDNAHVDFEEPEAEVVNEHPPQEDKKKKKKEKVKPILLNKDEQRLVVEASPAPSNHLEEIQPKDDLQLKHKTSKDDFHPKSGAETVFVETMVESTSEKTLSKPLNPKGEKKIEKIVEKVVEKVTPTLQQEEGFPSPPIKERTKKKRSELATLQQMSGDREGVNVNLLVPLVRKAELSRSEVQILIDLLLNKQQGSTVGNSEWIEGRQDPVVKLKKQLAEKEKFLQEEQEASQSLQSKLKELRSELNSERSRLLHNCRQLEESLLTKQNEVQALATRLQHAHESHLAEKQALTQQNQQLNEEQGVLHSQRQQLELHIAHLTETSQEGEAALKTQIAQLHGQLQEQESIGASLNTDLQKLRESHGENKMLRDQLSHLENQIRHLESQVAHFKESSERAQELARQNEELHRIKTELEHHVASARQHEAALQYESEHLCEELETLKEKCASFNELRSEVSHLKSENERLIEQVAKLNKLQLDTQHFHEENERLMSQVSSFAQLEAEAQQLREENETLAAQVTAMTDRPAVEGRENDLHYPEEKEMSIIDDVSLVDTMVQEKELMLDKLNDELKQKDLFIEKLNFEINTCKTEIRKVGEELQLQKAKNDDLRTKNWKAMEALSVTEKSLELKVKESKSLVSEISRQVRMEEQTATRHLLQRIFPEIRIEENKDYERWVEKFETMARSLVSQASVNPVSEDHSVMLIEVEKQNSQLQAMVTHYKTIIEETEGMLNKLQNHVEQEEARWRQQLQIKESELEAIREERDNLEQSLEQFHRVEEVQSKLQELQRKLQTEESEKRELLCKYEELQNSCDQLKKQVNLCQEQQSVELHVKEESERLSSELKNEQARNHDLLKEVVKLKSLVQIGQDSLSQEQQLVQQLQQQLDKLTVVSQTHNVAANGPSTEPSATESFPQPLSETSVPEKRPKIKKKKGGSGKK